MCINKFHFLTSSMHKGSVKSTTIYFVKNLIVSRITTLFQKKKQ